MHIKKNDKVTILAGKDKGKTGKVLQIFSERDKASVEGLNLLIKHMRPRRQGQKGQRIEFPAPISLANLMLVCPKCGKATRSSRQMIKTGQSLAEKKVRVCRRCKEIID